MCKLKKFFKKMKKRDIIPPFQKKFLNVKKRLDFLVLDEVLYLVLSLYMQVKGESDAVSKGCSSTGRAPVSKTGGYGFDPCHPCHQRP